MEKRVYNFSAGPCTLPLPVMEQAQRDFLSFPGAGMSVMEMSHRSKWFDEILAGAEANIRKILDIPSNYKVLFLHGGASFQFGMIPLNFLRDSGKPADYIVTGSWGKKAIKEGGIVGQANTAWDGTADNYNHVPDSSELKLSEDAAYVHFTTNETIQGVQFQQEPETGDAPLIADMPSDIFSRPLPIERYSMIYAGAQKNAGPAGVCIAILRDDMLDRIQPGLTSMLDYRNHVEGGSRFNTPPTFTIYMIKLVTDWLLKEFADLNAVQEFNRNKSSLLYRVIDESDGYYIGHSRVECRSPMNVSFRIKDDSLNAEFLKQADARGLMELKGHRSVGGFRASIYNAMTRAGVVALRDYMLEFKEANGRD